jgi:NADPH:quinone reductase-like Zn-dependent oxidoreductase
MAFSARVPQERHHLPKMGRLLAICFQSKGELSARRTIASCGPGDFRIGDFAELIAVKQDSVAINPKNISMEEAVSMHFVGLTAWQALVEKGRFKKGQKVSIQSWSGGVGTFEQAPRGDGG